MTKETPHCQTVSLPVSSEARCTCSSTRRPWKPLSLTVTIAASNGWDKNYSSITASITINFYDTDFDDGIRTSSMTQSMMVMLVDGDTQEEEIQPVQPSSVGVLTLTVNGVAVGTYNGTATTINIPASESSSTIDGDTIVSTNNVLKVAVGIKGASLAYVSASHSINLAQGGYAYSAVLPYASQTND